MKLLLIKLLEQTNDKNVPDNLKSYAFQYNRDHSHKMKTMLNTYS